MKNYKVCISYVLDPFRDRKLDTPETITVEFDNVLASNESEARDLAKEISHEHDNKSVWESWAYEN